MLSEKQLDLLADKAKNTKFHKNAFNCSKCPKEGCPAWWDFTWTLFNKELKTHVEKKIEGCGFVLQPIFMADMITTTYRNVDSNKLVMDEINKQGTANKQAMISMLKLVGGERLQKAMYEKNESVDAEVVEDIEEQEGD